MSDSKTPQWFLDNIPEDVINSTIFKFEIKVSNNSTIAVDILRDLELNEANIREGLVTAPSQLAFWSSMFSEVKSMCAVLERRIKFKRASLLDTILKESKNENIKLTDKQITIIIESNEDLNKLEVELIIASKHCGKLYGMIEAIKMKCDNLRTIAGYEKIEMQRV